jgi:hypothetical protein
MEARKEGRKPDQDAKLRLGLGGGQPESRAEAKVENSTIAGGDPKPRQNPKIWFLVLP